MIRLLGTKLLWAQGLGAWEDLGCCDSMCPLTDGSGATSASAGGLSSFQELRMGEEEVETTRGAVETALVPLVPPSGWKLPAINSDPWSEQDRRKTTVLCFCSSTQFPEACRAWTALSDAPSTLKTALSCPGDLMSHCMRFIPNICTNFLPSLSSLLSPFPCPSFQYKSIVVSNSESSCPNLPSAGL